MTVVVTAEKKVTKGVFWQCLQPCYKHKIPNTELTRSNVPRHAPTTHSRVYASVQCTYRACCT